MYTSRIAGSTICDRCIRDMAWSLSRSSGGADQSRIQYTGWSWVIAVFPLAFLIWFGLIFHGPTSRSDFAQVFVGLFTIVYATFDVSRRLARAAFNADRIAPFSWLLTGMFFGLRLDRVGMLSGGLIALVLWAACYFGLKKYGASPKRRVQV